jgi:hypothetical protein
VEFQFFPLNHSVVRAEYTYPCIPYEMVNPGKQGFFSGFKPVDAVLPNPPVWRLTINDTNPIFYYCAAPGACVNDQMVGVINPNATTLIQTQIQDAKNSNVDLAPGEPFPSEGGTTVNGAPSSLVSAATAQSTTTPSSTPSASSAPVVGGGSSFPKGAIAGIVVAVVAIIALAAALFFYIGKNRQLKANSAAETVTAQESGGPDYANKTMMPMRMSMGPGDHSSFYGGPGTVFIPVKASDLAHGSLPPYGIVQHSPISTHDPVGYQPVDLDSVSGSHGVQYR